MVSDFKKRDLFWAYSSMVLNIGIRIILFPIILHYLSAAEVGLWFVFITLGSLSQIFEPGFNSTIARNIAYILSGANSLLKEGVEFNRATKEPRSVNINLLREFMYVSNKIYTWMTWAAIVFLMVLCSYYIHTMFPAGTSLAKPLFAWLCFSAGYVINLRSGIYIAFFQGKGDVSLANKVLATSRLIFLFIAVCLLMLGFGLLGIGVASIISSVFGFLLARSLFQLQENKLICLRGAIEEHGQKKTIEIILHSASRIGIVTLSAFLIQRAGILLTSSYLGLEVSSAYALSLTICMILNGISTVVLQVQIPRLNALQITENKVRLRRIFGTALIMSTIIYTFGLMMVVFIGGDLLKLVSTSSKFLPTSQFFALGLIFFMELINGLAGAYLMSTNKISFVKSNLISGVLIVFFSYLSIAEFSLGIWGLILCHGVVQLSYNNWKWISISIEDLGGNFIGLLIDGKNEIKRMIYGHK